jgi:hypothetical protein
VKAVAALGPGALEAGHGAGAEAGLLLQDFGRLAGEGDATDLESALLVGGGDGAGGGRFAGSGAAYDLREVGLDGGVVDGRATA